MIHIIILQITQMTMCNVTGAHTNKPTENYHLTVVSLSSMWHVSLF